MTRKLKAAIIGSGDIGTGLTIEILRHGRHLQMGATVGIDPVSDGLARAQRLGVATTHEGSEGLARLPVFAEVDIVFDATSAGAQVRHDAFLRERKPGIRLVDLTPAAIGPYCVSAVNGDDHLDAVNVSMVTCGGQATIPMVAAVSRPAQALAAAAAGPGQRPDRAAALLAGRGGLYGGLFTAIEAAGDGAAGGFLVAWGRRALNWSLLGRILVDSATTMAMLFVILIGAMMFANFVTFTGMPDTLKDLILGLDVEPIRVVVAICVICILLGTATEESSLPLLTLPVFFPIVTGLGMDPVWFGILMVCVVEIGLISLPVGMNVFVLRALVPDGPVASIWRGLYPFLAANVVRISLLIALPVISLWLPRTLGLMQ